MLKRNYIIGACILLIVLIIVVVSVGCSVQRDKFDVSGQTNEEKSDVHLINTVEDIKNIVTDDDKLVINYFDAYIWVITFDDNDIPEEMTYIYQFKNEDKASEMVSVRRKELENNHTMKVSSCKQIEAFVVAELTDSSFDNITREMLENNFNGLIVY